MKNHDNNSQLSSISNEGYSLFKIIQKFVGIFRFPERIHDFRLNKYSFLFIILTIAIIFVAFASYVIYDKLLNEIQSIFFADGAVSDIMQLT